MSLFRSGPVRCPRLGAVTVGGAYAPVGLLVGRELGGRYAAFVGDSPVVCVFSRFEESSKDGAANSNRLAGFSFLGGANAPEKSIVPLYKPNIPSPPKIPLPL